MTDLISTKKFTCILVITAVVLTIITIISFNCGR
jgi:hypothetical protein